MAMAAVKSVIVVHHMLGIVRQNAVLMKTSVRRVIMRHEITTVTAIAQRLRLSVKTQPPWLKPNLAKRYGLRL
jgi:hypothetical protein